MFNVPTQSGTTNNLNVKIEVKILKSNSKKLINTKKNSLYNALTLKLIINKKIKLKKLFSQLFKPISTCV